MVRIVVGLPVAWRDSPLVVLHGFIPLIAFMLAILLLPAQNG